MSEIINIWRNKIVVTLAFNVSTQGQRQVDLCEVKADLAYTRPAHPSGSTQQRETSTLWEIRKMPRVHNALHWHLSPTMTLCLLRNHTDLIVPPQGQSLEHISFWETSCKPKQSLLSSWTPAFCVTWRRSLVLQHHLSLFTDSYCWLYHTVSPMHPEESLNRPMNWLLCSCANMTVLGDSRYLFRWSIHTFVLHCDPRSLNSLCEKGTLICFSTLPLTLCTVAACFTFPSLQGTKLSRQSQPWVNLEGSGHWMIWFEVQFACLFLGGLDTVPFKKLEPP